MKLKQLESLLQDVTVFENPKVELEQYPTTPHLAARLLYTAFQDGSIQDKIVCDLGVGCGILSIGSAMLEAAYTYGIDIDSQALQIASENISESEVNVDLLQYNIEQLANSFDNSTNLPMKADTVIMNPPFGTRNHGMDMTFLKAATYIASENIYSLHKTSTRQHILKTAASWGWQAKVVAELAYNIDSSYKFHKLKVTSSL